ncbi:MULTISPECIES: tRNA (adenosine(37)-N6)-threonylcarbamoyltransferase complex ATPase subunit type 1 TsaE [unclassified Ensifer]|uniref:tRNA (adenosine(37)-N6)-threonylcarbamoyltransferase complex ATPase subunit type 1 TsaE n=1 Tax=unclassified Ensifer TaxID=2633371 RepID=UPI0008139126|nr:MULTISPECIES: tRNA (adenosine(37)-N6)-threonylcarbamoyltransferase complex ATPase subunit type 1 TsaE [unclassified Ensifer]OCO99562.1 tRNA (N6-adenosine(37)-N6)-threonylcarbamoyltransferase complex ATPase TsaE [Ensifer sp. LC14]OCP07235.1 tRNA (N6-adenosine(37)-N6)-threonylcarbamoyltransferase complex ATPase TsaE [Ensifer sp. LC13]OCP12614.1 tRNA (N6-adenosine(37)-N6)-threonylcarbamoyltransferase complex ATPase TsaE [Ensifer sp. LC11]OCP31656.1 tRNA (N6-adenosine(37)-N6)-threonylcarbamoyltr
MPAIERTLSDEAATIELGEDLALALKAGDCVALSGDLGAGKSTFARAFLRALADDDGLEVPSPTFTLVQTYELRIPVAHFDLYRLADSSELDELGFDEALSQGICLVEWPERAEGALPAKRIMLTLAHENDGRRVEISGAEDQLQRISRSLAIRDFLNNHGHCKARRRHLSGDASIRAYERIYPADGSVSRILMDSPRHKPGPILQDGKYYQQLAHIAEDVVPFVAIDQLLIARGFAAPTIHARDLDQGILLIEDLGSEGVLDEAGQPIDARYIESARLLARLHSEQTPREIRVDATVVHRVPDFDRTTMKIETRLLTDWYLPWKRGEPASDDEKREYSEIWDGLIDLLQTSETNLLLRDFHSPNIIWREERRGLDRIGLIDFQDAMIGPTAYDVASLVQDARVTISSSLASRMMQTYLAERHASGIFDEATFSRDWHLMSAQRNCKLVGIWVRLMQRDGKPGYMKHMPRTFAYLQAALSHESLKPLHDWCMKTGILNSESAN